MIEQDAVTLLQTAGVGTFESVTTWGIYIGKMPRTPDGVVLVTHSGGTPSDPKWLLDFPALQVRVRAPKGNYQSGKTKAQAVKDALLGLPSQAGASGDRWVSVTMLSDIAFMGYDDNERPEFSVNFRLIVQPQTGTNRTALP